MVLGLSGSCFLIQASLIACACSVRTMYIPLELSLESCRTLVVKWFTLADGEEAVGEARWDFGMVVIPKDLSLSGELVQGLGICAVVVHRVAKYSFMAC